MPEAILIRCSSLRFACSRQREHHRAEQAETQISPFNVNGLLTLETRGLSPEQKKYAHNRTTTKDLVEPSSHQAHYPNRRQHGQRHLYATGDRGDVEAQRPSGHLRALEAQDHADCTAHEATSTRKAWLSSRLGYSLLWCRWTVRRISRARRRTSTFFASRSGDHGDRGEARSR